MTYSITRSDEHAPKPIMTTEELSEYIRIPIKTIYRWRHHGEGPKAITMGRYLRWREADVEAWIEERCA